MKQLVTGFLAALFLTFSSLASANGFHRHHGHGHGHRHHHWHHNHSWVVPALVGGAVAYAVTRPYIIEQPLVIQQPQYIQQTQVVIDGVVYNKQIMVVNGVQQEVLVRATQ